MPEQELLKELHCPCPIILKDHKVVEIDVRRSIGPQLNPDVISPWARNLEACPLFDRSDLDSYSRYGEC